ncbi:MAG: SpoIID/LytB domain-containing protein, partial [Candidatus Methanoperedens sp.]|nr:SpoIID/LytB domain-containing protein [Candidatus Methanoperedens sp.]
MSEKKLIKNWYRKKIVIFFSAIAILILILASANNASATPTPTSIPSGDTIRVYRSATGQIDVLNIETEYLPYVVAAENDIAPFESMKAQAVASRTFAYYKKEHPSGTDFDVYDDGRDQNYKPWLVITNNLKNSVSQTNGIVIKWGNVIICSFYVSGAGDFARYVTYNEGKSGENIAQSSIGWVTNPPSLNPYNRGAMGQ